MRDLTYLYGVDQHGLSHYVPVTEQAAPFYRTFEGSALFASCGQLLASRNEAVLVVCIQCVAKHVELMG